MARFVSILGYIWLLPVTLFGILLAPILGYTLVRVEGDLTLYFIARLNSLMYKWFDSRGFAAITVGAIIIYKIAAYDNPRITTHEKTHVHQGLVFGVLWPIVYFGESVSQYLTGHNIYWDNRFEVQARRSEQVGRPLNLWE